MSGLRQLRSAATQARREARRVCAVAMKEARAIANVRAAMIKANELKLARQACERAHTAALALVAAYNRARPTDTPARSVKRAKRAEKRQLTERDAVDAVRELHSVPERVAELAVRRAVRRARGARQVLSHALLVERAGTHLQDAWLAYEREMGPPGFVRPRHGPKKKKRAKKKRGARIQPVGRPTSVTKKKRRRVSSGPREIIIIDENGVPF